MIHDVNPLQNQRQTFSSVTLCRAFSTSKVSSLHDPNAITAT